jgi:hypothetical protein
MLECCCFSFESRHKLKSNRLMRRCGEASQHRLHHRVLFSGTVGNPSRSRHVATLLCYGMPFCMALAVSEIRFSRSCAVRRRSLRAWPVVERADPIIPDDTAACISFLSEAGANAPSPRLLRFPKSFSAALFDGPIC